MRAISHRIARSLSALAPISSASGPRGHAGAFRLGGTPRQCGYRNSSGPLVRVESESGTNRAVGEHALEICTTPLTTGVGSRRLSRRCRMQFACWSSVV